MSKNDANDLSKIREKITQVDNEVIKLLASRRKFVSEVAEQKISDGSPIRDPKRENDILIELIKRGREQGLDAHFITKIFHEIIDDSVRTQQEHFQSLANPGQSNSAELIRVAFHGIEGSYSHLAARRHFARKADKLVLMGQASFEDVAKAVETGQADYAILPIENTASGGNNEVYDLLLHSQISIVGEEKTKVDHSIIGSKKIALNEIKKIFCRPSVLSECSHFIARFPNCKIEYLNDSASSLKKVKEEGDPTQVAIASEEAAALLDLVVLEAGIANQSESFNRYIVAARQPVKVDTRIPCKTSLVMSTAQKPGALVEALASFKEFGINLTKLESRPIPGNPWEENFYLDFEGNVDEPKVAKALSDITKGVRFIKVLGSYPSYDLVKTSVSNAGNYAGAKLEATTATKKEEVKTEEVKVEAKPVSKKGYKLASRDYKSEDTVIEVGGVKIGGDNDFVIIAGPCSVESYDQIMLCAKEAREHGTHILRGGCYKPRTSPYSFQGLGLQGLDYLVDAGRTYGMPVVTEVMSEDQIEGVAAKSDILQIGARNMQNFSLLKAIGRTQRPVMLKRGLSSSIEDLLLAVEYILSQGNQQVFLCERGIRTFETATRNTLDLSAVPVLKRLTHLPIFVDPSHAAGERDLVPPLALAAKAVGAHGIMIEFHPEPEKALSDGPQSLRFPQFEKLMQDLSRV